MRSGEAGPSTEVSEAGWNDAIAINLTGSFLGATHQIAEMLKYGGGSVTLEWLSRTQPHIDI